MRDRNILRRLGVLVLVLALVAVACGDDDEGGGSGEPGPVDLTLGYVLPQTGPLSAIVDALVRPVEMAQQEIEEAGDTLTLIPTDSGTDPAIATNAVDELLNAEVNGILGPASTTVSLGVIDRISGAEVPMCSGSNTGSIFTDYDDDGYYFRTSPPDNLQGQVHADLITEDGATSVALAYRSDEYGRGLAQSIRDALEANGVTVVEFIEFDKDGTSFDAEAAQIAAAGVDAVSFIPFAEGAAFLQALIEAGVGPDDVAVYTADGFVDNVSAEDVDPEDPSVLEGIRATYPSVAPPSGEPTFPDRFAAFAPDTPTIFSAHFYDCTIIMALAAVAAGSTDPQDIAANINAVTRDGTKCTRYAECRDLLLDGENIDYDGASGLLDFIDAGEPAAGTYVLLEYDAEGGQVELDQVDISS